MRCLALAEALMTDGWTVGFACSRESTEVMAALRTGRYDVLALGGGPEPAALARRWPQGCDLLIVDHYGRDATFERDCRPWAERILVIDDLADRPHDADILLDKTHGRDAADYEPLVPPQCIVLTGAMYALLRPAFTASRVGALAQRDSRCGKVGRILVCFGTSDPDNATGVALEGVRRAGLDAEVDVVLGAKAPNLEAVRRQLRALPRANLLVDAEDMAELMASADLAIGAGGGTSWERCCFGLPTLMVVIADNQRRVARALQEAGAVLELPPEAAPIAGVLVDLAADPGRLAAMSEAARALCDGTGTDRVLRAIAVERSKDGHQVWLRPAKLDDAHTVFRWQCRPETRRHFHNPEAPTWEEHRAWFAGRVADDSQSLLMIQYRGKSAGVVRLDAVADLEGVFEVSILIEPEHYRLGLGQAGLALLRHRFPAAELRARVLSDNRASHALFRTAGYRELKPGHYVNVPHLDSSNVSRSTRGTRA